MSAAASAVPPWRPPHCDAVAGLPNTVLREVRALRVSEHCRLRLSPHCVVFELCFTVRCCGVQELDHPNVVQLLDVFPQGSSLVLVFELMRSDLAEVCLSLSVSLCLSLSLSLAFFL